MRTIYFTLVIVILSAVIGVLVYDKYSGVEYEDGDFILKDSSYVSVDLHPYSIRDTIRDTTYINKNVYKKVSVSDTADKILVKKLLFERDSLQAILLKRNVSEISVLDTIVEPYGDSILAVYSVYDKIWLLEFSPAPREVLQINKTHVLGRNIMKLAESDKGFKVDWKWIPATAVLTGVIVGSAVHTMEAK